MTISINFFPRETISENTCLKNCVVPTMENNGYKNGAKIAFQQDGNIQNHSLIEGDHPIPHMGICDTHTHTQSTQPVMSTIIFI